MGTRPAAAWAPPCASTRGAPWLVAALACPRPPLDLIERTLGPCVPAAQSSIPKAWTEFDEVGRLKDSGYRDRVVDVAGEGRPGRGRARPGEKVTSKADQPRHAGLGTSSKQAPPALPHPHVLTCIAHKHLAATRGDVQVHAPAAGPQRLLGRQVGRLNILENPAASPCAVAGRVATCKHRSRGRRVTHARMR